MPDEESGDISLSVLGASSTAGASIKDEDQIRTHEFRAGGYHDLAALMSDYTGVAIFRRFKWLHILKLLYLQAEITKLERDLDAYAKEDEESSDKHRQDYCRNFIKLRDCETELGSSNQTTDQYETWQKIRVLLREYNETLQLMNTVLGMHSVDKHDLRLLNGEMQGYNKFCLPGIDWDTWKRTPKNDLLALKGFVHNDNVSKWVLRYLVPWYHNVLGHKYKQSINDGGPLAGVTPYKIQHVAFAVSAVIVATASGLPIVAVAVLSLHLDNRTKIILMGFFTFIFALCLGLVSGAKKTDMFAASAAFAVVLVVFVSGNGASGST